jgi:hypothetical protein
MAFATLDDAMENCHESKRERRLSKAMNAYLSRGLIDRIISIGEGPTCSMHAGHYRRQTTVIGSTDPALSLLAQM